MAVGQINYLDLRETLFSRLLGLGSVYLHVTGILSGRQDIMPIIPVVTRRRLSDILGELLPEFSPAPNQLTHNRGAVIRFLGDALLALAGVGLAVSGLLLQSATGNDLCSPNIIGVNSGAGFAVMVLLCLFPMAFAVLPLAAFAGALFTTFLVLGISVGAGGHQSKSTVLLAGVAVSSLLSAGSLFFHSWFPMPWRRIRRFRLADFPAFRERIWFFPRS